MKLAGIVKSLEFLQVADVGLAVEVVPVPGGKLKGNPLLLDDGFHKDIEGCRDGKPNLLADAGEFRLVVAVQPDGHVCHGLPPEKISPFNIPSESVQFKCNRWGFICNMRLMLMER